uniref:Sulfhydryl oxidase n=1 Tax=Hyaloperonospora arabidopsidis (strain Emoy2) TaxID=559515 RepID=M4BIR4_HYAAE
MQLLLALASTLALLTSFPRVSSTAKNPKEKGAPLFPDGHPNITFLTDKNWDEHMAKTTKPWLVDFYHPFCPHCKEFAPLFVELAAYYKEQGSYYVGAMSCMDHVKCRRVGITGFPTLMALNFDVTKPKMENKRIVGTHTVQEVKDYVNSVVAEVAFNTTGTWPPGYTPPVVSKPKEEVMTKNGSKGANETSVITEAPKVVIWEESTLPTNQTTRLQDAASAFVFGLKQGVFMGSDVMDEEELDALKGWLKLVSTTFPGAINRKVITLLYEQLKDKEMLDFDTWDAMLKAWQEGSVAAFKTEEDQLDVTGVEVSQWQRLNDLFLGQGATYRACALYTCGQWNMFHMLTMNPPESGTRSDELMVSVAASIRRFTKHFFGCADCREHFLKENTVEVVKKIKDADDKPLALRRWLWEQHNSVNKRVHHPIWPKQELCPTCGTEGSWEMVEVDKWLSHTYVYRDVGVPLVEREDDVLRVSLVSLRSEVKTETTAPTDGENKTREASAFEMAEEKAKSSWPTVAEPKGGDEYRPKDAELGIKNAANTKELVANTKTEHEDGLQGVAAPRVTLFAWYILPVAAVGGYFLFVRSRAKKQRVYRQVPRD